MPKKENIFWKEQTKKKNDRFTNYFLQKVILIVLQNYEFTKVSFKGFYI